MINFIFAENQISFTCYLKRGRLDENEEILYEPVHFIGHFSKYFNAQYQANARTIKLFTKLYSLIFTGSDVDTDNMLPRNNNSTGSTTHSYQSDTSDNRQETDELTYLRDNLFSFFSRFLV